MDTVERILAALGLPPATTDVHAEPVTTGYASDLWRVRTRAGDTGDTGDTGDIAVRRLAPYADLRTELATMAAAAERGVPVPRIVATARHDDHDVVAMTWCPGVLLADALRDGGDVRALGRAFGRTQSRLHRLGRDGRVVCHGDYHPQNVLVDGADVSGVVDWSDAYFGDPHDDLAATWVTLLLIPALAPEWDPAFDDAWRDGYGDFPDPGLLAPAMRTAAARQRDIWVARAAAGAVRPRSPMRPGRSPRAPDTIGS